MQGVFRKKTLITEWKGERTPINRVIEEKRAKKSSKNFQRKSSVPTLRLNIIYSGKVLTRGGYKWGREPAERGDSGEIYLQSPLSSTVSNRRNETEKPSNPQERRGLKKKGDPRIGKRSACSPDEGQRKVTIRERNKGRGSQGKKEPKIECILPSEKIWTEVKVQTGGESREFTTRRELERQLGKKSELRRCPKGKRTRVATEKNRGKTRGSKKDRAMTQSIEKCFQD